MSYFSENEIAAAMTVKLDDVLPEKQFSKKASVEHLTGASVLTQAQTRNCCLKMPFAIFQRDSMRK